MISECGVCNKVWSMWSVFTEQQAFHDHVCVFIEGTIFVAKLFNTFSWHFFIIQSILLNGKCSLLEQVMIQLISGSLKMV